VVDPAGILDRPAGQVQDPGITVAISRPLVP
jgi:hypothetical protein